MNNSAERIRLGLPKGSLNAVGRGNTQQIFLNAGFDIKGYEPGKESDRNLSILNAPEVTAYLTRPQSVPVELNKQLLDIAITGEDWYREETANGVQDGVRKIGDLEYGQTRLVIAVPENTDFESLSDFLKAMRGRKKPIICFTEYVNLTRQAFMENPTYQEMFGCKKPVVQVRSLVDGENRFVQIFNSDGVTEGYIPKGADIIVDNTQSGSTLRAYGLREMQEILRSTVGLYAGPSCKDWKDIRAQEIFDQLKSAVRAGSS